MTPTRRSWCTGTARRIILAEVDGAEEEKSQAVPPHGGTCATASRRSRRAARWVHTHVMAMSDLNRGAYTGQFAFVYVEPKNNSGQVRPGSVPRHPRVGTPSIQPQENRDESFAAASATGVTKRTPKPNGWEIGYQRFTINGKCLGHGDPIRVKEKPDAFCFIS